MSCLFTQKSPTNHITTFEEDFTIEPLRAFDEKQRFVVGSKEKDNEKIKSCGESGGR